ncbi:SubName: Full=Related to cytochrome P450 CYP2 subfamily-Aspergillus oryzae {ECO:0000313/EMBL:CCA74614.1} [Serendipita indica DSM 11827]|uniref:Related to cytochrome P450 CYP2 subfamily-Aspergillus oryzae n=1 Tax=Serendipita indica (strain DSM 11827) TaxID=1109443 RepID=G4TTH1_SERID|nr:SubName: Full=Related to cytochrome P450 CYP2 subfamily-Aspergillus oryzae {ECO:0000313/EMBL:CCA74614.1} [Serendipita indica DSM 11827]CCA74614.1 related to cytochrome P450 CYP2 subfamily-Aspergillus oryzae [Serendipita indica DSM 11827]
MNAIFDQYRHLFVPALASLPALALVYAYATSRTDTRKRKELENFTRLPPGPPRLPFIGNLLNFPQARWYETFSSWAKEHLGEEFDQVDKVPHGQRSHDNWDLMHLDILGSHLIVIHSLQAAKDLMEKRGATYSDRPRDMMSYYVMGWNWNVVVAQPGSYHTNCRTIYKRSIGQTDVAQYEAVIVEEAQRMLEGFRSVQGDPWDVIEDVVGAVLNRVTYGDSIYKEHGKAMSDLNHEMLDLFTWASTQFWLVNFIPKLHSLPGWIPLSFKKIGKKGQELQRKMHYWPWQQTVDHFKRGIAEPSIALEYLDKDENLNTVRDALGMMYSAGIDNTASTFASFISQMLLHPHIQKKIQAEIDAEAGLGDTLPSFEQRPQFRYLDAAWRESMRLNPSAPLGISHVCSKEDVYEGYYIPKYTCLVSNIGFMGRDPRVFTNPDSYTPERWLPEHNPDASNLPDVYEFVFGFGRRICPGQFLADRIGFVFAAAVLKMYDILPLEGEELPKEFLYQDAITRRPEGVRCRFVPRKQD